MTKPISFQLSEAGLIDYVQKNQNEEIETLMLRTCYDAEAIYQGRKMRYIESRHRSEDEQNKTSQDKANNFRDKRALLQDCCSNLSVWIGCFWRRDKSSRWSFCSSWPRMSWSC